MAVKGFWRQLPSSGAFFGACRAKPLGKCLDVGCGEGDFLEDFLGQEEPESGPEEFGIGAFGFTSYLGVDVDPNAISEGKRFLANFPASGMSFRLICGDILDSGILEGETFDSIMFGIVLHHFADPAMAMRSILTKARPGASILIKEMLDEDLDRAQEVGRDIHHLKACVDRILGIPHNPTFTWKQLTQVLASQKPELKWDVYKAEETLLRDRYDPELLEQQDEFITSYLGHVQGHERFPELSRALSKLRQDMREYGILPQPEVLVFGRMDG